MYPERLEGHIRAAEPCGLLERPQAAGLARCTSDQCAVLAPIELCFLVTVPARERSKGDMEGKRFRKGIGIIWIYLWKQRILVDPVKRKRMKGMYEIRNLFSYRPPE